MAHQPHSDLACLNVEVLISYTVRHFTFSRMRGQPITRDLYLTTHNNHTDLYLTMHNIYSDLYLTTHNNHTDLYLTTHNIHKTHTSMSPVQVKTAIPASGWP